MTSPTKLKIDSDIWWQLPQELRFLLAGAYNTAFGFLLFAALYHGLGAQLGYIGVAVLCHAISMTSAFIIHRCLVFRSTGAWQASFLRFNLSQLAVFLCGTLGLYTLVQFARINPVPAQAIVMLAWVLIAYGLHRNFSFRIGRSGA